MSFSKTWSGDWHARILERVRQRGFESLTQYTSNHPGVSLLVLADDLGPDDIAAAQIRTLLVEEAVRTRTIPFALRDLFVRELRDALPEGWRYPLDDESRYNVTAAIVRWEGEIKEHLATEAAFRTGQDFRNAEFPDGWLPAGPDDPVIVAFVDRCLGRAPS